MDGTINEFRLANMFYEQRGPLVFSASVHLALIVVFGIWSLVKPEKPPEELVFELVSPPSGGYAQAEPFAPVVYERGEQAELPTEDEIVLPERPMVPVREIPKVEEQPLVRKEPVVVEKPVVEEKPVEQAAPTMSREEFLKAFNKKDEAQNVRTTPREAPKIDLSKDISKLKQSLNALGLESLPRANVSSMSVSDQQTLASYLARLREALRRSVERHPIAGAPLQVVVSCDISGGGHISNVRVVKSSGDPAYDRKVVDAFKKVRIFDAPPDNLGFTAIPFRFVQE